MRKTSDSTKSNRRGAMQAFVAIALSGSLAVLGCTTNRTPGYGEPAMSAPAAGSVAPNATSTPGSSSGTMPQPMISSGPAGSESAAVDAMATIKADQAFRGKNLGPAAPGDNSRPSQSMLQPTGQTINVLPPQPGFYATTPAFFASADTGVGSVGAVIVPATGVTGSATIAGTTAATPITGAATVAGGAVAPTGATIAANVPAAGNAVAAGAPATMTTAATSGASSGAFAAVGGTTGLSSTTATPILTGVGPLPGTLTAASGGTVTSGSTRRGTTVSAGVTASPAVTTAPLTAARVGTTTVGIVNPAAGMSSASVAPSTAAASDRLTLSTTTVGSTTAGVRVETTPNGGVVVTNSKASALRRFLNSIGFRRTATTTNQ